jgi:hypothetical protein
MLLLDTDAGEAQVADEVSVQLMVELSVSVSTVYATLLSTAAPFRYQS